MRKHETQRQIRRQAQLRNNRFEIMTISTQAVQPDYAADGTLARSHFYAFR